MSRFQPMADSSSLCPWCRYHQNCLGHMQYAWTLRDSDIFDFKKTFREINSPSNFSKNTSRRKLSSFGFLQWGDHSVPHVAYKSAHRHTRRLTCEVGIMMAWLLEKRAQAITCLCCHMTVWLWASDFISHSLVFIICRMGPAPSYTCDWEIDEITSSPWLCELWSIIKM